MQWCQNKKHNSLFFGLFGLWYMCATNWMFTHSWLLHIHGRCLGTCKLYMSFPILVGNRWVFSVSIYQTTTPTIGSTYVHTYLQITVSTKWLGLPTFLFISTVWSSMRIKKGIFWVPNIPYIFIHIFLVIIILYVMNVVGILLWQKGGIAKVSTRTPRKLLMCVVKWPSRARIKYRFSKWKALYHISQWNQNH